LTSKIINMANRLKDAEDQMLESIFRSEPIADDGFSRRIVARIRRRIWLRRLTLPVAMLVGGSIAAKPVLQLAAAVSKLLMVVPQGLLEIPVAWVPQLQTVVIGAMLLVAVILGMRMLEE
jgi:hypothetical protein